MKTSFYSVDYSRETDMFKIDGIINGKLKSFVGEIKTDNELINQTLELIGGVRRGEEGELGLNTFLISTIRNNANLNIKIVGEQTVATLKDFHDKEKCMTQTYKTTAIEDVAEDALYTFSTSLLQVEAHRATEQHI